MTKVKRHYHIIHNVDGLCRGFVDTASNDPLVVWHLKEYGNRHAPTDLHAVLIENCQIDHTFSSVSIKGHTPRQETDGQIRCRECGQNFDSFKEVSGRCPGIPDLRPFLRPRAKT